jgi:hypothetical protein
MKLKNTLKSILQKREAYPVITSPIVSRAERRRRTVHCKPVGENLGVETRDGVPIEVANAMLFTPGTKLTTAMRKNCLAAREAVLVSTRVPKDYELTLKRKAKNASALQLVRWAKRIVVQRAKVTRDHYRISTKKAQLDPMALHDHAKLNRILAAMDVEAQRCDASMASYRTEAERRLISHDVFDPIRDDAKE